MAVMVTLVRQPSGSEDCPEMGIFRQKNIYSLPHRHARQLRVFDRRPWEPYSYYARMEYLKEEIMKTLRITGLLVFAFALSGFAIADEAKTAPKNIPDFDVQGISMTECQCTAYACHADPTAILTTGAAMLRMSLTSSMATTAKST